MLRTKFLSKGILPVVAAGVLGLASAQSAHAIPTLSISDVSGHTLTLSNPSGGITFTGLLGNFSLNITSVAATGDALLPALDFSATGYGTLMIKFSNTSFGTLGGSIASQISGQIATGGVLSYLTYASASNNLFGASTLLSNSGPFQGGTFSGKASATYPVPGPFSMTEMIVVSQSRLGTTSFGATLVDPISLPVPIAPVPDAGATAPLLGLALLAIGLARRKLATP